MVDVVLFLTFLIFASASLDRETVFWNWLRENGAQVDKLEWPVYFPPNLVRGTAAKVKIHAGEDYLRIPEKLVFKEIKADYKILIPGDYEAKVATLVHERIIGKNSFWKPYLDTIEEMPHSLMDWKEDELMELQDSELIEEAQQFKDKIGQKYKEVAQVLNWDKSIYTLELFTWAYLIFAQRSFGVLNSVALVPLADNLNHVNVHSHFEMTEDGYFRLLPSDFDLEPGEECWNAYGFLDNSHLLLNYGFVLFPNSLDLVRIVSVQVASTRYALTVERYVNDHHPKFAYRQFLNSEEEISIENEISAVVRLLSELKKIVSHFITPLEEDYRLLATFKEDDFRKKNALKFRIDRKEQYSRITALFIDYYHALTKSENWTEDDFQHFLALSIERKFPNGAYKKEADLGLEPSSPLDAFHQLMNFEAHFNLKDEL
jgi:hypothetical protein